ncbi:MAG: hydrogenase formation protein HypD [Synergistota bacterium]|nr:hydrogenase formation protein HypD [Synergistota bacterium]
MSSVRTKLLSSALKKLTKRPTTIMEVCGTHTVSIFRQGLRSLFPEDLKLISGPGCPVCVTSQGEIDGAIELATRKNMVMATYGDMMRVPGSNGTLGELRGSGSDVRVVLSAMETLRMAEEMPHKEIVFLAVGFETTAPATAALLIEARKRNLDNLSVLCLHKRVPPALKALSKTDGNRVDGFLLPGHVAVILGHEPFKFIPERYGIACTIAGFEADEIMLALVDLLEQIGENRPSLTSRYEKAVRPEGNVKAVDLMNRVFDTSTSTWRGIGPIDESGMSIKDEYSIWDGARKFNVAVRNVPEPKGCRCGEILSGTITPKECPLFGTGCTPITPVGPCMVSSEGTCSAWYRYGRKGDLKWES